MRYKIEYSLTDMRYIGVEYYTHLPTALKAYILAKKDGYRCRFKVVRK